METHEIKKRIERPIHQKEKIYDIGSIWWSIRYDLFWFLDDFAHDEEGNIVEIWYLNEEEKS